MNFLLFSSPSRILWEAALRKGIAMRNDEGEGMGKQNKYEDILENKGNRMLCVFVFINFLQKKVN